MSYKSNIAIPRSLNINKILFVHIMSIMSIKYNIDVHIIYKKSNRPKEKSLKSPYKHRKAKCILQPAHKSKNVISLSRSSNDHNNGEIQPQSKSIHVIHKKPLKQRVNSISNSLIKINRIESVHRNRYSKAIQNKCSLEHTLT